MLVLGIESSCDETSAAVVQDGTHILSNIIASQAVHIPYGGVVPELASRAHVQKIIPIIETALAQANIALTDIDGIAVTNAPGLVGSLLVGVSVAKGLAYTTQKPLVGVNHLEGHLFSNFLGSAELEPPLVSLVVSGGHTLLVDMPERGKYQLRGQTRDDAAGEAFDKIAKWLELGYPGGPIIDKLAAEGDPNFVEFPPPIIRNHPYDFSFSGLKTAVLYYLQKQTVEFIQAHRNDILASFQEAVVKSLVERTIAACLDAGYPTVTMAGGVACNRRLRAALESAAAEHGLRCLYPSPILCTDNGAMIAAVGDFYLRTGKSDSWQLGVFARQPLTAINK